MCEENSRELEDMKRQIGELESAIGAIYTDILVVKWILAISILNLLITLFHIILLSSKP